MSNEQSKVVKVHQSNAESVMLDVRRLINGVSCSSSFDLQLILMFELLNEMIEVHLDLFVQLLAG